MYLSSRTESTVDRFDRTFDHELHLLRCDACGKEWEIRGSIVRLKSRATHACSNECKRASRRPGGTTARVTAATNVERYGAENVYAAPVIRERIKARHIEARGVDHPSKDPAVIEKIGESTLARFGVRHAAQSPVVQEKIRTTMRARWGVERPMQLAHVQHALEAGCMAKHGVRRALQAPGMFAKVHEARKVSGAYARQSRSENEFHAVLVELFGHDDVERWVVVNSHWPIDFHVRSADIYVQFDGAYWHGLDRPLDEIRASSKPRDRAIAAKWELDRRQDAWFAERGMRLVRVTDTQFKGDPRECLRRVIEAST